MFRKIAAFAALALLLSTAAAPADAATLTGPVPEDTMAELDAFVTPSDDGAEVRFIDEAYTGEVQRVTRFVTEAWWQANVRGVTFAEFRESGVNVLTATAGILLGLLPTPGSEAFRALQVAGRF
jgi:hypothetical protein